MPVGWEIIRSYTHIDEQCKDGSFNIKNYNDYMKTVMKYVKLNEYDLKLVDQMSQSINEDASKFYFVHHQGKKILSQLFSLIYNQKIYQCRQ